MIFNIQRFSTHDGSGIRTIVFYKGCPLSCAWCSNPESQAFGYSLMYDRRICKSFGDCLKVEPGTVLPDNGKVRILFDHLKEPGKFKGICLSKALTVCGEEKTPAELMQEVEKDIPFYRQSNGGVTLSGGEPLSQGIELITFLNLLLEKNIDVSAETTLHVRWSQVERCLGLINTFLVDLKHTDPEKFSRFTGGDALLVMDNLRRLSEKHDKIIIRVPVVPGFNHTAGEMEEIIDFTARQTSSREIHFLPFHNLGKEKYTLLGMEYTCGDHSPVDESSLYGYVAYAESKGLTAKIGG